MTWSVAAVGTEPLRFQWRKNGVNIAGASGATYTIPVVTATSAGGYSVVVSNTAGSVTSQTATLTVTSATAPTITIQPQSLTRRAGQSATFAVVANGTAPFSFQWRKNGVNLSNGGSISGVNTAVLAIASTQTTDSGSYTVIISNSFGAVTSSPVLLTVSAPPETNLSIQPNGKEIVLSWSDPAATLEEADSVTGPWKSVGGDSPNPRVLAVSASRKFYRLHRSDDVSRLPNMVIIPVGTFTMGDSFGEGGPNEGPVRSVYLSAFYMDKYPVTKALWDEVYLWATKHGYSFVSTGYGKAADHPVQTVSWYDAAKWCNARSEKEGRPPAYYMDANQTQVYRSGEINMQNSFVKWSAGYRLPTETEWEKAARGLLSGRRFPWGDTISHSQANYYSSSSSSGYDVSETRGFHPQFATGGFPYTNPVNAFEPNGYGVCDMAGNVWNWCWDSHGPVSLFDRAIRGGSWGSGAENCRTAFRGKNGYYPGFRADNIGFRTVLPQTQ